MMTREFYIPDGAQKVAMKSGGATFYLYTSSERLCAVCFIGKAHKPAWRHWFRSEADREKKIRATIAGVTKSAELKAERKAKRKVESQQRPFIGAVLNTCWGYDQTNREFFQVVGHRGKTMVVLQEINQVKHYTGDMNGNTAPVNDDFIGEPFARQWSGSGVKIDDVRRAWVWDGKAVSFSEWA